MYDVPSVSLRTREFQFRVLSIELIAAMPAQLHIISRSRQVSRLALFEY